jgi:SAM-dependent methyltransferase
MTLDLQLSYWNQSRPSKTFSNPVNLEKFSRWVEPSARILDYGCGYGRVLGILQSKGYTNLIGVDPALAMIASARQRFPTIAFETLADFRTVELPTDSVDAVLLFMVLTCVPTDQGQHAILAEIHRVLRPGGILYISDLWLQTGPRNIGRYAAGEKKYGTYGVFDLPEGVTLRHHKWEWIKELTRAYELLSLDEIEVQTMNGNAARAFQWFGRSGPGS